MKLTRIGSERPSIEVERIEIEIGVSPMSSPSDLSELKIHAHADEITVKPCCANEVAVKVRIVKAERWPTTQARGAHRAITRG